MGQVPAFEGADGFTLTESLAIAIYGRSNLFVEKSPQLQPTISISFVMMRISTNSVIPV